MSLELLHPGPPESIDPDNRERLLGLYRPPRAEWLRLNLISTVTGSTRGSDGTSETLTNPVDRRILGVIRELSDVVLIGAQSLRAEGYQHPRRSRLAVVTLSGNLQGHHIEAPEGATPIVICPESATQRVLDYLPEAELIVLEARADGIPVGDIIHALRARGLSSIVCEGGPTLVAQVLDAGLVDEFCLSIAPVIGGVPLPVTGPGELVERRATLTQLLRDDANGLYARWALQAPEATR